MATSRRQQMLDAVVARLRTIERANGFQTDAGKVIYFGETPMLGADDPDEALAVVVLDTQPGANRMEVVPIEVQGIAKADLDQPQLTAEAILADIATAMEQDDRTFGGVVKYAELGGTRTVPREPGSTAIAVGITYQLQYARVWGQP